LKLDLVAQSFESAHEVLLDHLSIMLIEVVAPEILIGAVVAQQMGDDDQDALADRDGSALGFASCGDAAVLSGQLGVLVFLLLAAAWAASIKSRRAEGLPLRVLPLNRLPALS
jgi:hypothetical protein